MQHTWTSPGTTTALPSSAVAGVMGAVIVFMLVMLCGNIGFHNTRTRKKQKWIRYLVVNHFPPKIADML
jgi:hypothetical protein